VVCFIRESGGTESLEEGGRGGKGSTTGHVNNMSASQAHEQLGDPSANQGFPLLFFLFQSPMKLVVPFTAGFNSPNFMELEIYRDLLDCENVSRAT
jgi:hypothetical protein